MSKRPKCDFCGLGAEREVELGTLHTLEDVNCHYFCMLFSSGLPQNGEDEEGILGFLIPDIKKELLRGKKLQCVYCQKKGATIGCSEKKCRRSYHYACGLDRHVLYKFTGDFRTNCNTHREYQNGKGLGETVECLICMDELVANPKTAVWAPCCNKSTWFHKMCIQRLALSAGYFFKCPVCNDRDVFTEEMQNFGIYIPEKDASWELEPNAYSELERPVICDATKCKCPDGRKNDSIGTRWEIILCNLCGASGIHVSCGNLPFTSSEWNCSICSEMLSYSVTRLRQEVRERRLRERKERNQTDAGSSSTSSGDECDVSDTPNKRKLCDVSEVIEATPPKMPRQDYSDTIAKVTYASDSDEEIDVELGEYPVPSHTVIRELEESGEELPIQLKKLKNNAIRYHERMLELRMTEIEIVKVAKQSATYKRFPLDKAMVMKFFRYNLPLDKMLKVREIIGAIYSVREAVVTSAQNSAKKKKKITSDSASKTGRRRSCRLKPDLGTPDVKVTFCKKELSKTLERVAAEMNVAEDEKACAKLDTSSRKQGRYGSSLRKNRNSPSSLKLERSSTPSPEQEEFDSPCNSPDLKLRLNTSFSPLVKTPIFSKKKNSATVGISSPLCLKNQINMDKENSPANRISREENDLDIPSRASSRVNAFLGKVTSTDMPPGISPLLSPSTMDDTPEADCMWGNGPFLLSPAGILVPRNKGKRKPTISKRKLSLETDKQQTTLWNTGKPTPKQGPKEMDAERPKKKSPNGCSSDQSVKKKRSSSHESDKYVQKTLTSYFVRVPTNGL